jgi:hypothetical protein
MRNISERALGADSRKIIRVAFVVGAVSLVLSARFAKPYLSVRHRCRPWTIHSGTFRHFGRKNLFLNGVADFEHCIFLSAVGIAD